MMMLNEIMHYFNHTYVDVLKIDIEGNEYVWMRAEPLSIFGRIGQLLIEVHDFLPGWVQLKRIDVRNLIEAFESTGLRIFHRELNPFGYPCCHEFSLIQSNWSRWDREKHKLSKLHLNISLDVL